MPKVIEIEIEQYKTLVNKLEILFKVCVIISAYEFLETDPALTLRRVKQLVFPIAYEEREE